MKISPLSKHIKKFTMPLIFLSALLFALFLGRFMPIPLKSFFYAVGLAIKKCLLFSLPFLIFSLVYKSFSQLGAGALKFLFLILALVYCSNFINTLLSYLSGIFFIKCGAMGEIQSAQRKISSLFPLFSFHLPQIISNGTALFSGAVCGMLSGFLRQRVRKKISNFFGNFTKYFFKLLIPLMPFFIIGTALKLQHDEMLSSIFSNYWSIVIIFIFSAYGYVLFQFLVLSRFRSEKFAFYLRNIAPGLLIGFGSMSSAAALPFSLRGAKKNLTQKGNAAIIVPSIVSVHLVGDCFFIPMIALAILLSLGFPLPDLTKYLSFALHFVLAKFAVAAVPGGGIFVMLPILQNYFDFNGEMLGLITALYVLFDPLITTCNIAGNGAMAILFDKITTLPSGKKNYT
ncbi:MAG: cation:dicarboxylase symporter family transporter [Puniceicoccales bacterium]|jgi:Na+/H+-dicarboxylate symporter|nr:cation:dicarboxylase symporter family transporter [Puniceicoccales bacterium]